MEHDREQARKGEDATECRDNGRAPPALPLINPISGRHRQPNE